MLAFEFVEQIGWHLAEGVDQHVEPAAVRHADDAFLHAHAAGALQQIVQQGNQAFAAFQREAFLPDIACMQVVFQPFGCGQPLENMALVFCRVVGLGARSFDAAPGSSVFARYR